MPITVIHNEQFVWDSLQVQSAPKENIHMDPDQIGGVPHPQLCWSNWDMPYSLYFWEISQNPKISIEWTVLSGQLCLAKSYDKNGNNEFLIMMQDALFSN